MSSEDFVTQLKQAMPSSEELVEYGLDVDEVEDIQSKFTAILRKDEQSCDSLPTEIHRLLYQYECSRIEIGIIRFSSKITPSMQGDVFAFCEADPIVIGEDGVVSMYDHEDAKRKVLECALTPEMFLNALAIYVDIVRHKSSWTGRLRDAVDCCSLAAGGRQYGRFYEMLLAWVTGDARTIGG